MLKKLCLLLLIWQLVFLQVLPVALADSGASGSASLSPTITPSPTPTDSHTPNVSQGTATSSATPTNSPALNLTATNSGSITNTASSSATSGNNTIATQSAKIATSSADVNVSNTHQSNNPSNFQNNSSKSSITTGNAVAVTSAENNVNTTSVNSNFVNQTINIYMTQNQNLDISVPLNIVSQLITKNNNTSPQITVLVNNNSYAVVNNNIVNQAVSGQNSASGSGQMVIDTGNSYSAVQLINKVNFTIVNSVIHVITINIFGTLNGNIILPDLQQNASCADSTCGLTAGISNNATVNNTVLSNATSGDNSVVLTNASGSATLTTGNAASAVNINNIVNANAIGVSLENLFINTFGQWNGKFLGWGIFGPQNGGQNYKFNGTFTGNGIGNCASCITNLTASNAATVNNKISSLADSGHNFSMGGKNTIHTGNAYSVVQLLNFVNSTFARTYGFFGFINIFGQWNGNIGDAQAFITPTPTPNPKSSTTSSNTNSVASAVCTTSGTPSVATNISNNIATYINAGDTALFYVHVNNIGQIDFSMEKVKIALSVGGKTIGGTIVNIKKPLTARKNELVTVGLDLSHLAPGGQYTATVTTQGITCDNKSATATASTQFVVHGSVFGAATIATPTPAQIVAQKVLGAHTVVASSSNTYDWMIYVLLGIFLLYVVIRGIRGRVVLLRLLKDPMTIKERLSTLRLLLL